MAIFKSKGDPYEYQKVKGQWETRKKDSGSSWSSLKGNTKAIDILEKRYNKEASTHVVPKPSKKRSIGEEVVESAKSNVGRVVSSEGDKYEYRRKGSNWETRKKVGGTNWISLEGNEAASSTLNTRYGQSDKVSYKLPRRGKPTVIDGVKVTAKDPKKKEKGTLKTNMIEEVKVIADAPVPGKRSVVNDFLNRKGIISTEKTQFIRDIAGRERTITEKSFTPSQLGLLREMTSNAMKDGRNYINYTLDYPHGSEGVRETTKDTKEANKVFKVSDEQVIKRTLGRANFKLNTAGELVIEDRYNFNESEDDAKSRKEVFSALKDKDLSLYNRIRPIGEYYGSDEGEGSLSHVNLGKYNEMWANKIDGTTGASQDAKVMRTGGSINGKQNNKSNIMKIKKDYLAQPEKKIGKLQEGGPMPGAPAGPPAGPGGEGGGGLEQALMQVVETQDPQLALQVCMKIAESMGLLQGGQGGAPAGPPQGSPMGRYGMKLPILDSKIIKK